jgi:hypothetical protein
MTKVSFIAGKAVYIAAPVTGDSILIAPFSDTTKIRAGLLSYDTLLSRLILDGRRENVVKYLLRFHTEILSLAK